MPLTVFYSWQSDLLGKTNRSLIEDALKAAIKAIARDDSLELDPVLDRDTLGASGSPSIAETIFKKIENAAVFVADVSIINLPSRGRSKFRLTPNPNVLVELGFAQAKLGHERVVMVLNRAYGKPEDLPFDLKYRKVVSYTSRPDDETRAEARKSLALQFEEILRDLLPSFEAKVPALDALARLSKTLEEGTPQAQAARARDFMDDFIERLDKGKPDFSIQDEHADQVLFRAIEANRPLVSEFVGAVTSILESDAHGALLALFKKLGPLWDRYYPLENQDGHHGAFDFYRFNGYELLVLLVRCLLKAERWDLLREVLRLRVPLENEQHLHAKLHYRFHDARKPMDLFSSWNERLKENRETSWLSPEGAFVKRLYQDSPVCTFKEFRDTDFFLYWCDSELGRQTSWRLKWWPYTAVSLRFESPKWLKATVSDPDFAAGLCSALEIAGVGQLRESLEQLKQRCASNVFQGRFDDFAPFYEVNLEAIA